MTKKQNSHPSPPGTDPELATEIEDLLEKVLIEEASAKVWHRFESALHQLDDESLQLFESYLDGVSPQELSRKKGLTQEELNKWISRIKRDLSGFLKNEINIKQ